eukprot:570781-Amphidinium_carterae.1
MSFVPSGTPSTCSEPKSQPLVLTLTAWLPVFLLPLSGSSSFMGKARKRSGNRLSTMPWEECGVKN